MWADIVKKDMVKEDSTIKIVSILINKELISPLFSYLQYF